MHTHQMSYYVLKFNGSDPSLYDGALACAVEAEMKRMLFDQKYLRHFSIKHPPTLYTL